MKYSRWKSSTRVKLFCIKTNIRRLWRKVKSIWTTEYPNLLRKLKLKRLKARKELRPEWRVSYMSIVHKGSKNQRLEIIQIKGRLLERTKRIPNLILQAAKNRRAERAKRKKTTTARKQEKKIKTARTPRAPDSHPPPRSLPSSMMASTWSMKANAKSSTTTMVNAARNWRRATSSANQKLSRALVLPSLETLSPLPIQLNACSSPKMNSWRFLPTKRTKSSSTPNKGPTSRGWASGTRRSTLSISSSI